MKCSPFKNMLKRFSQDQSLFDNQIEHCNTIDPKLIYLFYQKALNLSEDYEFTHKKKVRQD